MRRNTSPVLPFIGRLLAMLAGFVVALAGAAWAGHAGASLPPMHANDLGAWVDTMTTMGPGLLLMFGGYFAARRIAFHG